jgi:hypothetical protein
MRPSCVELLPLECRKVANRLVSRTLRKAKPFIFTTSLTPSTIRLTRFPNDTSNSVIDSRMGNAQLRQLTLALATIYAKLP